MSVMEHFLSTRGQLFVDIENVEIVANYLEKMQFSCRK